MKKLFKALHADWQVHEQRNLSWSQEGPDLKHRAAVAWSESINALTAVVELEGADEDLKSASRSWLKIVAGGFPDSLDIMRCGSAILTMCNGHRSTRPDLAALLQEAYALTDAYRANLALMSMHRAAD